MRELRCGCDLPGDDFSNSITSVADVTMTLPLGMSVQYLRNENSTEWGLYI